MFYLLRFNVVTLVLEVLVYSFVEVVSNMLDMVLTAYFFILRN